LLRTADGTLWIANDRGRYRNLLNAMAHESFVRHTRYIPRSSGQAVPERMAAKAAGFGAAIV
jgi:hypothetical protein